MDTVKVAKPKKKGDEWKVAVFINGKYSEDDTYYTDDEDDAKETRKSMIEDFKKSKKYQYEGDDPKKTEKKEKGKDSFDDFDDEDEDDDEEKIKNPLKEDILRLSELIE